MALLSGCSSTGPTNPDHEATLRHCTNIAELGRYVGEARQQGHTNTEAFDYAVKTFVQKRGAQANDALRMAAAVYGTLIYRLDQFQPGTSSAYALTACMIHRAQNRAVPSDPNSEQQFNRILRRCEQTAKNQDELGACVLKSFHPLVDGFEKLGGTSAPATPRVALIAPDVVENGEFVPVIVKFQPGLKAGERLTLKQDGHVVAQFQVKGPRHVEKVSVRVRALKSGTLLAILEDKDGKQTGSKRELTVERGATIPERNEAKFRHRSRVKNGEVQMLVWIDSARDGYIKRLTLDLPGGSVEVLGTPYLSKNPYFAFKPDQTHDTPSVELDIGGEKG